MNSVGARSSQRPESIKFPPQTRAWIRAARRAGLKIDSILAYGNRAYPDHYDTGAYAKAAAWLAGEARK